MRIMYVVTRGDSIGGAQIHVRDLARRMTGDRHDVLVVTGVVGPLTDELTESGIAWELCPDLLRQIHPLRDVSAVAALRRTMRRFQPDLVSTHSSKAGFLGRIAARLNETPCLFTAHGWSFAEGVPEPRRMLYRWLERSVGSSSDRIICVSRHDHQLAQAAGIRPDRLVTVHNGVPDVPKSLRARPDSDGIFRLVMVARFDAQKDHATLLQALYHLSGVELDLIGDGPNLAAVQAHATRLGLTDRVRFLGRRPDVDVVLSQAHAFVLCSHWEGFPRSTLEAMRAALPVIVTDVGGAAEAVVSSRTGFVVPPGDVPTLHNRLGLLADRPELRAALGRAGRDLYERRFTFDLMYQETTNVYELIVERRVEIGGTRRPVMALESRPSATKAG